MRFAPHSYERMDTNQGPRGPGARGRSTLFQGGPGEAAKTPADISPHEGPGGVSPLARQKEAASQHRDHCASTAQSNRVGSDAQWLQEGLAGEDPPVRQTRLQAPSHKSGFCTCEAAFQSLHAGEADDRSSKPACRLPAAALAPGLSVLSPSNLHTDFKITHATA